MDSDDYHIYMEILKKFKKMDQENFQGYGEIITIEHILPLNDLFSFNKNKYLY